MCSPGKHGKVQEVLARTERVQVTAILKDLLLGDEARTEELVPERRKLKLRRPVELD